MTGQDRYCTFVLSCRIGQYRRKTTALSGPVLTSGLRVCTAINLFSTRNGVCFSIEFAFFIKTFIVKCISTELINEYQHPFYLFYFLVNYSVFHGYFHSQNGNQVRDPFLFILFYKFPCDTRLICITSKIN